MITFSRRALLALPLLAAAPALAQTSTVAVESAWARATMPSARVGGAFLTLKSATGDALVSVASPVAGHVELHQTVNQGGVMKMLPVERLELPAGQAVTMKPGGYHLMLMELKHPLKQGSRIPLTLTFAHAAPVTVEATVEGPGAAGPMHMHMKGM